MNRTARTTRRAYTCVALVLVLSLAGCLSAPPPNDPAFPTVTGTSDIRDDEELPVVSAERRSPEQSAGDSIVIDAMPNLWIDDTISARQPAVSIPLPVAVAEPVPPIADRDDPAVRRVSRTDSGESGGPGPPAEVPVQPGIDDEPLVVMISSDDPDVGVVRIAEPTVPDRTDGRLDESGPSRVSGPAAPGVGFGRTIDSEPRTGSSTTALVRAPESAASPSPVSVPAVPAVPMPPVSAPSGSGVSTAQPPASAPVSVGSRPTVRSSPAASDPWNERATEIAVASEVSVILPGSGWLYVGKEYGDGDIRLLGKSRSGSNEVFRFRIDESGDYGLWFQQQDAVSGSLVNERLGVRAVEADGPTSVDLASLPVGGSLPVRALPASGVSTIAAEDEPSDAERVSDARAEIRDLLAAGERTASLERFVAGVQNGSIDPHTVDVALVDRLAAVARGLADDPTAAFATVLRSFWRTIASSGGVRAPDARRGLLEIALRTGRPDDVLSALQLLEAAGEARPLDLLEGDRALAAAGDDSAGLPLLARAVSQDEGMLGAIGSFDDDRLFALARLLEQPGPDRDLRRAATLYGLIVDDRPLSAHWDDSRSRLEYLHRHYFEVR